MFFWRVLVWVISFGGIAVIVSIAFSTQADLRKEEADILAIKIADCLVDNGYIRKDIQSFDIFQECKLDKKIIDSGGIFYFDVLVWDLESGSSIYENKSGVSDFEMQCSYKTEEKQLAECSEKTIHALNQDGKPLIINITTASNQLGKSV